MAVLGIVAFHEFVEVCALERARLERKVHVRAEVVDPELLGPGRFGRRLFVEEQHVCLHSLRVEQARGQAQFSVSSMLEASGQEPQKAVHHEQASKGFSTCFESPY
jgi:hypothetical protein